MDEYIPQLTLTPDLSAQAQPEVKKEEDLITKAQAAPETGPDLSALSPAEQQAVLSFAKQIDLENAQQVLEYGASAQKNIADFSDTALAKVKTAMLLIQKDSEARGYAPFIMRPSPLFTHGYFLLNSADAAAVNRICTGAATLQDEAAGVYDVDLARLWSSRWQNDFSFPQFKYLLYTHSDKLPLNAQLHLTPAMQLTLEWHANADARFSVLLRALKEIFFEAARSGQYLYDRDAAARLAQATGLSSTRTTSAVRVVLAAVQSWQQHSSRLQRTRVLRRGTTQEGAEYSVVDPFISEFFQWLEQSFAVLHSGETCRYLPVNDSVQGSERLTPALGVLEELDLLHFALLGGSNSRLYLYVNQTQTLELADRGFYRNHLLERIAQRHTDAGRLMSWLFTSGFSSEQLWDRIEEYFLGLPIQGFDAPSAESR